MPDLFANQNVRNPEQKLPTGACAEEIGRSLAKVPGLLGKLAFLAGRCKNGRYEHWGLCRIYGETEVDKVLRLEHVAVFMSLLGTPLSELFQDSYLPETGFGRLMFTEALFGKRDTLVPTGVDRGFRIYFDSILESLFLAARSGGKRVAA